MYRLSSILFVCLFSTAIAGRLVTARQAPQQQPAPAAAHSPSALPPGYAGSDTCVVCHDDQGKSIEHSKHGRAANPRTPTAALGCETCHGPGQAHVDDEDHGKMPS